MKFKNKEINPGDYIEVFLPKKNYKGSLIEAPEDEKGIFLLKLDSGYNIGLNKKNILDVDILKKFKEKEEKPEIKKDKQKPNIAMIITGGTIASKLDPKIGGVKPLTNSRELFKFYPELFKKVNISKIEIPFMKASEDTDFKDWKKIAKTAERLLNDNNIKGLIITHGTDFLHYTSAALSFFLKNLNKPVVLTYSQRSIDRASSDANLNLQCSALAAVSDIAEVMIVGHANSNDDFCYAMPGTKVRKIHTSKRDAFKIINEKPIARIYSDRIEIVSDYKLRNKNKVKPDTRFEEKVGLLKIYPGQNPDILDYYLDKGYKGLVLEMSGLGHVPGKEARKSWIERLRKVQRKGMIVCAASQTIYGRLDPFVYSTGREILNTGVIYLEDMLAETALVKLGYILAKTTKKEDVKKLMLTNMVHELNDCLEN